MIRLRKNAFSEQSIDIPFQDEELVSALVDRTILTNGYELNDQMVKHFQVILNGHIIEKEFWPFTTVKESDEILIAPRLSRGEGGQLFKQIATIVIIAVASYYLGPAGAGLAGAALGGAVAAVAIGTSLLLGALIPPPALGNIGGLNGSNTEDSQMYSITGQQNASKKFGYVPRVYGSHRIFPVIAANPYTELEADPDTGKLVQFFYAIYDFGYGPLDISELRIGDTPINQYADVEYRLVDLNKPAVSEGYWDDNLVDDFQFYKGDVERDGTAVAIDKNQSDAGAFLEDYQVVRQASSKIEGNKQEISLDFVCAQGLISYGTNGKSAKRTISLQLEFSKVGEDVWRAYNDKNYVYDFSAAGGSTVFSTRKATIAPIVPASPTTNGYVNVGQSFYIFQQTSPAFPTATSFKNWKYGYVKGTTSVPLLTGDAAVGEELYIAGTLIGEVASISASAIPGYSTYNLVAPSTQNIVVFEVTEYYADVPAQDFFSGLFYGFNRVKLGQAILGSDSLTDKVYVKYLSIGSAQISGNTADQVYATFKFRPREIAQFKVRITRKSTTSTYTYRTADKLTFASLSTRFDRVPIITHNRHVFLELKIRATNQINGNIQNLSGVADSILDVYDPNTLTWSKQKTQNPAWVFCDLMTGTVNKRKIPKSRLHLESIVEWANFCEEIPQSPTDKVFVLPRFTCNFILDFDTTLQSLLNNITNSAQASLNVIDGKYGILIDKKKTIPVQIFTQRNSWGFNSTRSYSDMPDALKIRYVDPYKGWDVAEAVVYDNGFSESNAAVFDELSSFACTNFEQAWRFGRYMMAQNRLRKETITINVDFENLVCTRGDFVQITQDAMRAGGRPARVKSIAGTIIEIDDGLDTIGALSYGYVYRKSDGTIGTDTLTVVNSSHFDLDGVIPAVGDLVIVGEVGKIVLDCLVKSVNPNSDLSATLVLVEKADAVYDSDTLDIIPDYNPNLNTNIDTDLAAPGLVEDLIIAANTWRVVNEAYQYYIDIDWEVPTGSAYETFEIYVDRGAGYNLVNFTKESFYEYIVDARYLNIEHFFKVLAVSSTGKKKTLLEAPFVSAVPESKITPPSDVPSLSMNITNQVMQLDWTAISDLDLREYILRYSPRTIDATWEASIPLVRIDKKTTSTSFQGRTGTYFIKALDFNGNESSLAAEARTTIPNLFDLNVIEETNDFPALGGELVRVESDSDALTLQHAVVGGVESNQFYPDGYYYYQDFLDLGEIYTVRLQSLVEAEGFTLGDLMSEWVTLDQVLALSTAGQAEWDVETQYRTTDTFNTIADWASLDVIDPISEGSQDNWTAWKKFIMGDATGRIFQFRLKLISYVASVTPRVFDGIIRADMPDRFESYNNLVATGAGLTIVYDPPFKGPSTSPNIQITQDNASQGDYYILENKTLDGFKITFYDKDGIAVTRQFDAAIKGYGRRAFAVI